MILREWRGRVPREKVDAYLGVLEQTGLKEYAATPGHRGTWVLVDHDCDGDGRTAEFVLLTLWPSREAIAAFAGEDIGRAVYYPEDDGFLLEKPERLRHYDVLRRP
ncbi:MAG TPA: hypothetical protein VF267_12585 [Gammaproteobacteria bacterium]